MWYDPNITSWAQEGIKNQNAGITAIASISGTTLAVTAAASGTITVGQGIGGPGVASGTRITARGTGTGGIGNCTVNTSQTAASDKVMTGHQTTDYCCNGEAEANQVMTSANSGAMLQAAAMLVTRIPANGTNFIKPARAKVRTPQVGRTQAPSLPSHSRAATWL